MRILVVTDSVPYPTSSGGKMRVYNLVKRVAQEHEIWLACFAFNDDEVQGASEMANYCSGVIVCPWHRKPRLHKLLKALQFAMRGIPFDYCSLDSEDLSQELRTLTERLEFDIVHMMPASVGFYFDRLRLKASCHSVLGWFDISSSQHDAIARIEKNPFWKIRSWLNVAMMHRWEPIIANMFERNEVVSQLDKDRLQASHPHLRIDVVPNGIDTQLCQPLPRKINDKTLLFIGSINYYPCLDAMLYFCTDILPIIQKSLPDVRLLIVGGDPPIQIRNLENQTVHVTGKVREVTPYYQQSSVAIVPIRAGGGTRLKILEAMAFGRPVVSTSIGCEGLELVPEKHLLIADTPEQFAAKTLALLTDSALYDEVARCARERVSSVYDWDIVAHELLNVYEEMAQS